MAGKYLEIAAQQGCSNQKFWRKRTRQWSRDCIIPNRASVENEGAMDYMLHRLILISIFFPALDKTLG